MTHDESLLWAPRAWIDGRWRERVVLRIGADGCFAELQPDQPPPPDATQLSGPVLPGLVNAHSHAFQRAFAGLAERRSGAHDDFWSWRDRMYGVALRISPTALEAVAAQLYAELLQGGYTQVCEFHYLHHAPDGQPYADPLTMCHALQRAANRTGIGLTLLPVLYERAGFAAPRLRDDQRRFATDVERVLALRDGVRAARWPLVNAGVAIHSLRAAAPESIHRLQSALDGDAGPIHIHIAEQTAEVDDCLAATGARPIEWLARHVALDARWHLVHATHATAAEIDTVAESGAGVVICPSTEANLGDGLTDIPRWLQQGTVLSIGSDSHVARSAMAELRLLEEGQRLALRRRNVAAAPEAGCDATAAHLFDRMLAGGAAAASFARWGLRPGARADLLVLDAEAPGLLGVPASHLLDALVFATDAPAFAEVRVAGRTVLSGGRRHDQQALRSAFADAMAALWSDA
ncbi:formimidoylglutamate deiminase [Aquincola sp. S2]|uniref:Formimidoylglutamate deiminase n=1 Tax=Pseudaquabacterium terrae TaxID=2732868 RepID=A0ABX2ETQ1_9BURK|nr:formimidoylglutamate deiminase [Aquabacterium terrae]NRF72027.1 formimidoylglutamate deiminase [Aquabacterium terrae]